MRSDITPHNATELTVSQCSAVAALVVSSSVTDAASRAGVDRSTVHRWLADDPRFVAALNQAKRDALDAIRSQVRAGASEAVQVVRDILASHEVGPAVRLKAALALLQSVGALAPDVIGPTDPEDAEAEAKHREFSRLVARLGP